MIKLIVQSAVLIAVVVLTTQCHPSNPAESSGQTEASGQAAAASTAGSPAADTALYAVLQPVRDRPSLQDSLMIRFTVINPTKDSLKFTTYHTPFEGLISKFLTVTDGDGNEVSYQGPMAKRVMPPPAETYHTLAPGQTESVTFDLKKCYKIETPGTYTLQYNAERISGIANGEAVRINVVQ